MPPGGTRSRRSAGAASASEEAKRAARQPPRAASKNHALKKVFKVKTMHLKRCLSFKKLFNGFYKNKFVKRVIINTSK